MDFAGRLRALMADRGIGVRALARRVYCDHALISRYASGSEPPSQKMARLIDTALGADGELAALARGRRTVGNAAQSPPGDLLALAWLVGKLDRPVNRRTVQGFGATLADTHDAVAADPAARLAHALSRNAGLTGETVGYLETRSLGFHWLECVLPGSHLFRAVLTHLSEVVSVLEACGHGRHRQRLTVTAGETALLAAWMAWDLGDAARAASLYRAAGLTARESGDLAITACAVIYQSLGASGPQAHARARLQLAAIREQLPPGSGDPATRAWLLAREAEAAAMAGDPAAGTMIRAASEALTTAQPQRERSWTRCLDSPHLTHARLIIATRLRNEALLDGAIRRVLQEAADPEQKKSARMLASAGLGLAAIGDVSEAVKFGWRSVEAVRQSRARYALGRLSELATALQAFDGARSLREEIGATRRELVSRHPSTQGSLPALN